jgi:hypothetical protein
MTNSGGKDLESRRVSIMQAGRPTLNDTATRSASAPFIACRRSSRWHREATMPGYLDRDQRPER